MPKRFQKELQVLLNKSQDIPGKNGYKYTFTDSQEHKFPNNGLAKYYATALTKEMRYDYIPTVYDSKERYEYYFIFFNENPVGALVFLKTEEYRLFNRQQCYKKHMKDLNVGDTGNHVELLKQKLKEVEEDERKANSRPRARKSSPVLDALNMRDFKGEKKDLMDAISYDNFVKYESFFPENLKLITKLRIAYIAPIHRQQKLLTSLWPICAQRYSLIAVEQPSLSMQNFLKKHLCVVAVCGGDHLVLPKSARPKKQEESVAAGGDTSEDQPGNVTSPPQPRPASPVPASPPAPKFAGSLAQFGIVSVSRKRKPPKRDQTSSNGKGYVDHIGDTERIVKRSKP